MNNIEGKCIEILWFWLVSPSACPGTSKINFLHIVYFANSFSANGHISPKLYSRVQILANVNLIVHHISYFPTYLELVIIPRYCHNTSHKVTNYFVKQCFICLLPDPNDRISGCQSFSTPVVPKVSQIVHGMFCWFYLNNYWNKHCSLLTYNCPHGKEVELFPLAEPGCQDTDQHHSRLFLRHGDNCSK